MLAMVMSPVSRSITNIPCCEPSCIFAPLSMK
jgi:hypothetical protein